MAFGMSRRYAERKYHTDRRLLTAAIAMVLAFALVISLAPRLIASPVEGGTDPGPGDRSTSARRARVELSGWCLDCHRIDAIYNHPVEMVPSMPVPANLPLFEDYMTCVTCHQYRVLDPEHRLDASGRHWLRGAGEPSGLCIQCHDAASARSSHVHATNLGKAHLQWDGQESGSPSVNGSIKQFDGESQACLSCHDGFVAAAAADQSPLRSQSRASFSPGASHPVGVKYDRSSGLNDMPLKPRSMLDPRVRLPDGMVTCGTCHSPYSQLGDQLVMSNDHSRLCLSCHDY